MKNKKKYGQHFLKDKKIAEDIVSFCLKVCSINTVLEIGPGKGILTGLLIRTQGIELKAVEIDPDCIDFLNRKFPDFKNIICTDFLTLDLNTVFENEFNILGNFPYNISTEILFRVLQFRFKIPLVVGMFQKEVAQRICASPGNKIYGVISVLLQLYYDCKYLFTVSPTSFIPEPKVQSAVIYLKRRENVIFDFDETLFKQIVKTAFQQRRKKLKNALSQIQGIEKGIESLPEIFDKRAEQLSVDDYKLITKICTFGSKHNDHKSY